MTIIEQIKAEIERLKKAQEVSEDKDYAQYELDVACGYDMACDDILSFLSALEPEKPMNLKGLDVTDFCKPIDPGIAQSIADHSWEMLGEDERPIPNDPEEAAREYAKTTFKKPHSDNPDEEVTIVEPDKYAGFIAGTRYEDEQLSEKIAAAYQLGLADKEKQMMSIAVEGTVYGNGVYTWVAGDIPSQFKYGDKVRVIVLPKED